MWQALLDFFAGAGAQLEKRKSVKWTFAYMIAGVSIKVRLFTPSDEEQRLAGAFVIQGELRDGQSDAFNDVWASLADFLRASFLLEETREQGESILQEF